MKKEEFEEFVRYVRNKLEEITERLERLERKNEDMREAETVEVNLSRMNVRLQQARKGVAMRIKFAKYVKANNRGEYYVILTRNDIRNLINALQTIKIPQTGNTSEQKITFGDIPTEAGNFRDVELPKPNRNAKVRTVRGGELG